MLQVVGTPCALSRPGSTVAGLLCAGVEGRLTLLAVQAHARPPPPARDPFCCSCNARACPSCTAPPPCVRGGGWPEQFLRQHCKGRRGGVVFPSGRAPSPGLPDPCQEVQALNSGPVCRSPPHLEGPGLLPPLAEPAKGALERSTAIAAPGKGLGAVSTFSRGNSATHSLPHQHN